MTEEYGSIFNPTCYEMEVRGRSVAFYANKVGLLSKLSPFISAMAGAIAVLMKPDNRLDTGANNKTIYDPTGKTYEVNGRQVPVIRETEDSAPAISPQLAQLRDSQRQDAIARVIKQFTNPNTHDTLAELVLDSCKDDQEIQTFRGKPKQLASKLDVELLTLFVTGLVNANMKGLKENADPLMRGLAQGQSPETASLQPQPATSGIG